VARFYALGPLPSKPKLWISAFLTLGKGLPARSGAKYHGFANRAKPENAGLP
jgi:hypothetical protein